MKKHLLLFLSFVYLLSAKAQVTSPAGNTYAVVIGISNYKSKGIRKLQFAHKDAEEFANFLRTAGVQEQNMRLLTDSMATTAAIYESLNWLVDKSRENDIVYFYFSGHGDMENITVHRNGFLLAQNTPRNNFINNALRIEDLNSYANTLSVKNVKAILITDACHSGKLTGNEDKGKFLVGEQLRKAQRNEIRITSSASNELSAENEAWGGGRGVFSFYLVNGLKGLAEKNRDGFVTLSEIKTFIDSSFAVDALLVKEGHKQTPVIPITAKTQNFRLAAVNETVLRQARNQMAEQSAIHFSVSADMLLADEDKSLNPSDYFLLKLKEQKPENKLDFKKLELLDKDKIAFAVIQQLKSGKKSQTDSLMLIELEQLFKANPAELKIFNDRFITILHDRVQEIINLYLEADTPELERRRYYNAYSRGYDSYPKMLAVAYKLTDPENSFRHILKVNMHYLAGVAARLKMPMQTNPLPLLNEAFRELNKAYKLEKDAPYILNELGILYRIKKQPLKALEYYIKASEQSSEWALPWANMANVYAELGQYDKGFEAAEKAIQLDSLLQNPYIGKGILYERTGNYLLSEEEFRKSIKLNTRHYLPFERLAGVLMKTARYHDADSFFHEAAIRKQGFNFRLNDSNLDGVIDQFDQEQPDPPCPFDTAKITDKDIMGNLVWGIELYNSGRRNEAEKKIRLAIKADSENPLAYHYLGKMLYRQQDWAETEIYLRFARQFRLGPAALSLYIDSLLKLNPGYTNSSCIVKKFLQAAYNPLEDDFMLASAYEKWTHYAQAETEYRKIIETNPRLTGGYYKLWRMLENTGRYTDAEDVIKLLSVHNRETGNREMAAFYKRMTELFPEKAEWHYNAGRFFYLLCAAEKTGFSSDIKYVEDDTGAEKYIDDITRDKMDDLQPPVSDVFVIPGAGTELNLPINTLYESESKIPGTEEYISTSEEIIFPRTSGILHLLKAEPLLQEAEMIAEVNFKIGDLYVWQGLTHRAIPHYRKSVDLIPGDAGTRISLLNCYAKEYSFKLALEQLDTLRNRQTLDFENMLLMAGYCMYTGRFPDALSLLNTALSIRPDQIPELYNLQGRLALLSKQYSIALEHYAVYNRFREANNDVKYNIARLYALTGNTTRAWNNLKAALDAGFNYGYVLEQDMAWDNYRNQTKWDALLKQYTMRKYPGSVK